MSGYKVGDRITLIDGTLAEITHVSESGDVEFKPVEDPHPMPGDLFELPDGKRVIVHGASLPHVPIQDSVVYFRFLDCREDEGDERVSLEEFRQRFTPVNAKPPQPSTVNHPPHYQGEGVECIDAIAATGNAEGFCVGNAIKYLWRWKGKGGVEDLKKARWYLDWLIGYLERQG